MTRQTTYPYCNECPTLATGEFIVRVLGETRGVRVALCEHHHETLAATSWVEFVKPAPAKR